MLEDDSEQVKAELARIVGDLCCVQSGLSTLRYKEHIKHPKFLCFQCGLETEHDGKVEPSLRASVVKQFLSLLGPQSTSGIKLGTFPSIHINHLSLFLQTNSRFCFSAFLDALPHLCQHVNLTGEGDDSQAVLRALTDLMEDPEPSVRERFSHVVQFLIKYSAKESEGSPLNEVRNYLMKAFCRIITLNKTS